MTANLAREKSSLKNMAGTTHRASARPSPGVKELSSSALLSFSRLLLAAPYFAKRELQDWR